MPRRPVEDSRSGAEAEPRPSRLVRPAHAARASLEELMSKLLATGRQTNPFLSSENGDKVKNGGPGLIPDVDDAVDNAISNEEDGGGL